MRSVLSTTAVLLVLIAVPAGAQDAENAVKLRLAQSYERAGDWERAVPIYESLLQSDPRNIVYYDALRRGYLQLKDYEKAIGLIESRLMAEKDSPHLLSALGGAYYLMGDEHRADSLWQTVIRRDSKNPSVYRLIAGQLMEYRLYDRAIDVFLQARRETGDPHLFLADLANLYGAFQQYDRATEEFVQLLILQPRQLNDIQSRMSMVLSRPGSIPAAREVIRRSLEHHGDLVPLRQLYAWVLMEDGAYREALEQYRQIDRLAGGRGTEMLKFARRALDEGQYQIAAAAFQDALDAGPPANILPEIRFGQARAVEEGAAIGDSARVASDQAGQAGAIPESAFSAGRALALYLTVAQEFPATTQAAQAWFRIGLLRRDRIRDLDGALTAFEQAASSTRGSALADEARLELVEVHIAGNDLEAAKRACAPLASSRFPSVRERALFRMAELEYFTANFDSAVSILGPLSEQTGTDLANDALRLLYFIEENRTGDPAPLRAFSRGALLERQGRLSEALDVFQGIVTQHASALLADDATLRIGILQAGLRRYDEALTTLLGLAREPRGGILRDRALLTAGEICETRLAQPVRAAELYEELLSRFPSSIHAEEARKRVRVLRGDAL